MKCDVCGAESDFDAAFIKNRKSQFGPKTLCPACWVQRSQKQQTRFFLWLLVAGVVGYVLERVDPDALIGHILLNFFFVGLFVVLSTVPHELGHAMAGRLLGWRVYLVVIGLGKPVFKRRWFGILFEVRAIPVSGATWMTPTDTRWFRTKRCLSILAGPAVNAAMLVAVILMCQGSLGNFDYEALPTWARIFAWANGIILVVNLWPYETKTGFALPTDGKQILQALGFTKRAMQQV